MNRKSWIDVARLHFVVHVLGSNARISRHHIHLWIISCENCMTLEQLKQLLQWRVLGGSIQNYWDSYLQINAWYASFWSGYIKVIALFCFFYRFFGKLLALEMICLGFPLGPIYSFLTYPTPHNWLNLYCYTALFQELDKP